MNIVLDTNVIVSGLLAPFGVPAEITRMVADGALTLCYDARILIEYHEVLHRPKFRFAVESIDILLDQIKANGVIVAVKPLREHLPDHDDEAFLEAAIAGTASFLVTGNIKHFQTNVQHPVRIVSPADFLDTYREEPK